jgi:MerR family transcriptional regulator, light-induced transcriptional regulator
LSSKCCINTGMATNELLRIGELSKRSGVSPELLRAWERRYGLLQPQRSPGGLRLYTAEDLERVRAMQRHLADGLAAAEAAALASRPGPETEAGAPPLVPTAMRDELREALDRLDEPAAQEVIDRLLATLTLDHLLSDVVMPYLEELGDRWERGEASIAQEHFATAVIRGRLLGLARGWGRGVGPLALLACLPGEHHDLGLIVLGLTLRARGWRIAYIGQDTPVETVAEAAADLEPSLIVLSGVSENLVPSALPVLRALAARFRVGLGGAAAASHQLEAAGIIALPGDPVSEADRMTAVVRDVPEHRLAATPLAKPELA